MRRLNCGSDLTPGFDMEDLLLYSRQIATEGLR
jgi:hypothetical protein